jgi:hypothetical protein
MPLSRLLSSGRAEMLSGRNANLPFMSGIAKMPAGWNAFQIGEQIIERIAVAMVDVATRRDRPKRSRPCCSMQRLAAARQIPVTRPKPVKTAVKILGEGIEPDWIGVPVCRDCADIHPFSVKNICSGVHLTVLPSLNSTATSGARLRVILGS